MPATREDIMALSGDAFDVVVGIVKYKPIPLTEKELERAQHIAENINLYPTIRTVPIILLN